MYFVRMAPLFFMGTWGGPLAKPMGNKKKEKREMGREKDNETHRYSSVLSSSSSVRLSMLRFPFFWNVLEFLKWIFYFFLDLEMSCGGGAVRVKLNKLLP
jgi:hypothetical protein